MATIVFVHGTGVRLKGYLETFDSAKQAARECGLAHTFTECAWGDALGVEFQGRSLPGPPDPQRLREQEMDFAQWSWLFADPLCELEKLTIRDSSESTGPIPKPGTQAKWLELWEHIASYVPSFELRALLDKGTLTRFWPDAWGRLVAVSPIPREAFEASAHEVPEAARALARAVIAQLHVAATDAGVPGPSRALRSKLFERLVVDWGQKVYGLGALLTRAVQRTGTRLLRKHRSSLSDGIAAPIGDILLYQSRGADVRRFIRAKIEVAEPPITLIAHSLGGIACVDLLASDDAPKVDHLITVGSQAPLFFELGALTSLREGLLPDGFPRWLNLFDQNDFLSYVGAKLWPGQVTDIEIDSGQPFPESHSAYFTNEEAWHAIREFIEK